MAKLLPLRTKACAVQIACSAYALVATTAGVVVVDALRVRMDVTPAYADGAEAEDQATATD